MNDDDLAEMARRAIRTSSRAWYPGLATLLADKRRDRLLVEHGLDRDGYGLERFLTKDPTLPPQRLASLRIGAELEAIALEAAASASATYEALGLSFYDAGALDVVVALTNLDRALWLLSLAPGCSAAVSALAWTLIPLSPPSPEYDVSHSDPHVPFSIFVSLTDAPQKNVALRLAEAILHETMHLQLSLIEEAVPLVAHEGATSYSPWKEEQRPIGGVLHGLYVFRSIDDFLRDLPPDQLTASERNHVAGRRGDIAGEIELVAKIADTPELTSDGRALAARLVAGADPQFRLPGGVSGNPAPSS